MENNKEIMKTWGRDSEAGSVIIFPNTCKQ